MNQAISIIIPVYNAEKYLDECILSILPQLTDRDEIIMIDDGSTDQSPQLCDGYASNHPALVTVIHQKNAGAAAARNVGLLSAHGDYIMFADGDDYVSPAFLNVLRTVIQEKAPDLILPEIAPFDSDSGKLESTPHYREEAISGKNGISVLRYLCSEIPRGFWGPYSTIVKRTMIQSLCFPPEFRVCEDLIWSFQLYFRAQTCEVLSGEKYFYRQHNQSVMHERNQRNILDCFSAVDQLLTQCNGLPREIPDKLIHIAIANAQHIGMLSVQDQVLPLAELKRHREQIFSSNYPRCRFFAWLWRLFGLHGAVRLLSWRRTLLKHITK